MLGAIEYHNRYSALGAVLAQQKFRSNNWDVEEFRTTAMGDVYRSRTFHSTGDNPFPTYSAYNQFGALVARRPDRDLSIPNASNYQDTTYTLIDGAGNVAWTGTLSRPWQTSGSISQSVTRSYYGADHRLRFQEMHSGSTGQASGSPTVRKGSWEEHWYDALGRKVLTRARRDTMCTPTTGDACSSYIERTVWDGDQILYELRGEGGNAATTQALNTDVSSNAYDYGKVGYVHAGGIDAPLVLMDGRVPNYNWRGLPESSVWLDGTTADCTIVTTVGAPCTTIRWPGNAGVYMKQGATSSTVRPTWVGSLLANGVGSTGMAYRRNQFYDGATGQFNQQDPIGLAGGANSYGFAGGDPVSYSDPFGLCGAPPDTPCPNPRANGSAPWYERSSESQVPRYAATVDRVAGEEGVDANLMKSIMFVETTHGYYDALPALFDKNKSVLPMNINTSVWGPALGLSREELKNPGTNIRAGARILKQLSDAMPGASVEQIATRYNNGGAGRVTDYGARVGRVYQNQTWTQSSGVPSYGCAKAGTGCE